MRSIFILSILFFSLIACKEKVSTTATTNSEAVSTVSTSENIDIATAKQLLASRPEIVLVDVRTPQEIAGGKIDDALEIDYSSPEFTAKLEALDKKAPYLVYCAAGGRSARALDQMKQMGFQEVYNLMDGYSGWSQAK